MSDQVQWKHGHHETRFRDPETRNVWIVWNVSFRAKTPVMKRLIQKALKKNLTLKDFSDANLKATKRHIAFKWWVNIEVLNFEVWGPMSFFLVFL